MKLRVLTVPLCALALTACGTSKFDSAPQASFLDTSPTADIPWQLTPSSTASRAQGEVTYLASDPSYGTVRGTKVALANLHRPMVPYPAKTATASACRRTFEPQAENKGAYLVEAAPSGPQKKLANGRTRQQVFFRIFYKTPEGVEVRQAAIQCTVARNAQVVSATPL